MQASEAAIDELKVLEGFRAQAYDDATGEPWIEGTTPQGNLTIGFGHELSEREFKSGHLNIGHWNWHIGISEGQASLLLELDKDAAEDAVNDLVRVELTQGQYDAMTLFVFNIGRQAFAESTLLRLLNDRKFLLIPYELSKWIHSKGKVNQGLVHRRAAEIGFFEHE